jgi:hypothetical protein
MVMFNGRGWSVGSENRTCVTPAKRGVHSGLSTNPSISDGHTKEESGLLMARFISKMSESEVFFPTIFAVSIQSSGTKMARLSSAMITGASELQRRRASGFMISVLETTLCIVFNNVRWKSSC